MSKPKIKTVWISGMVPVVGADVYGSVRLSVHDSKREALAELVEWCDPEEGEELDTETATEDEMRAYLVASDEIRYWNIESREVKL